MITIPLVVKPSDRQHLKMEKLVYKTIKNSSLIITFKYKYGKLCLIDLRSFLNNSPTSNGITLLNEDIDWFIDTLARFHTRQNDLGILRMGSKRFSIRSLTANSLFINISYNRSDNQKAIFDRKIIKYIVNFITEELARPSIQ